MSNAKLTTPAEVGKATQFVEGLNKLPLPTFPKAEPEHGDFHITGPVWWIGLDNDQTQKLQEVLAAGQTVAPAAGPYWAGIAPALAFAVAYIQFMNRLGNYNGGWISTACWGWRG